MPLTDEQKEQLSALLPEAEPSDLEGYVSKQTLKGRLSEKDKKVTAIQADHDAKLDALQAEHAEAQAKLAEYENAGKSAQELTAQKLAAKEAEIEAWKKRHNEASGVAEKRLESMRAAFLRGRVTEMIGDSGIAPSRISTAVREALAENAFDVVGDPGSFSLQMKDSDGLPVGDSAESFAGWYTKRTDLHSKTGSELNPPGARQPPGAVPTADPTEGLTDAQILRMGFAEFG